MLIQRGGGDFRKGGGGGGEVPRLPPLQTCIRLIYLSSKNMREIELKFGVATIFNFTKFDKNLKESCLIDFLCMCGYTVLPPSKNELARSCKNLARILHARLGLHAICPFSCTILHQFLQDLAKNVQEMQVIILAATL